LDWNAQPRGAIFLARIVYAACIAWAFSFAAPQLRAADILWTIQDASFLGGGILTGDFVVDPSNNQYVAFDFYVTEDGTRPAYEFDSSDAFVFSFTPTNLWIESDDNNHTLAFLFATPVDVPPPPTVVAFLDSYLNVGYTGDPGSGSVTGTTVPEPGSVSMLLFGILGLIGVRRRSLANARGSVRLRLGKAAAR